MPEGLGITNRTVVIEPATIIAGNNVHQSFLFSFIINLLYIRF
jgi:hypothetical protein